MTRVLILLLAMLCAPMATAQTEADLYELALAASADGNDAEASIFLKNALQRNPMHLPSRILLGQLHLRNGEPAAAEKELRQSLAMQADPNLVLIPLGYSLLLLEDFSAIIEREVPPEATAEVRHEWSMILGRALLGDNQYDAAYAVFAGILKQYPGDLAALLGQANALFAQRNFTGAQQVIDGILRINEDVPSAWKIKGDIARLNDQADLAIDFYTRTLAVDPSNFAALKDRAVLLMARGDGERALDDIEKLRAELPNDPGTILINAWILANSKQDLDARQLLDDLAKKLDRVDDSFIARNAQLQLAKGITYYLQDRMAEALPLLDRFLSRQPDHVGARLLLAEIARGRGQTDRLLRLLQPIEKELGDSPALLAAYLRGLIELGQSGDALSLAETLYDAAPGNVAVRQLLAGTLAYLGETNRAISVLSGGDESSVSERSGLLLGYLLLEQNQLPAALDLAEQLQTGFPESATVANFLGAVLTRTGNLERAETALATALSLDDQSLPIQLNRAYLTLRRGDQAAARAAFARLAEQYSSNAEVLTALSAIDSKSGATRSAIEWTERLVKLEPENYSQQYHLAALYLKTGQAEEALDALRTLEKAFPLDERLLQLKARALLAEGDLEQARRWLTYLFGANSDNPSALATIAELQLAADDAKGAQRSLDRLRDLQPDLLGTQILRARFALRTNDVDAALSMLDALQAKHPGDPQVLDLLADAYWMKGDLPAFRAHYAQAQEVAPSARRLRRASQRLWQIGQPELALQTLGDWAQQYPDDLENRERYAQALLGMGQAPEAYQAYKELLAEGREISFSAYNNLANLAIDLEPDRALDHAIDYAQRAFEMEPEDAAVIDTLAWILVLQGNAAEGLPLLRDAYSRASQNPAVQYHLAAALVKLERHGEAVDLLNNLLATHARFSERDAALELLSVASGAEK